MEQPPQTNIDATNEIDAAKEIIELDDDAMEQVTGAKFRLSNFHMPGLYQKVGLRTSKTTGQDTKHHPVYKNRLTGNEHVQYPNGSRLYI